MEKECVCCVNKQQGKTSKSKMSEIGFKTIKKIKLCLKHRKARSKWWKKYTMHNLIKM